MTTTPVFFDMRDEESSRVIYIYPAWNEADPGDLAHALLKYRRTIEKNGNDIAFIHIICDEHVNAMDSPGIYVLYRYLIKPANVTIDHVRVDVPEHMAKQRTFILDTLNLYAETKAEPPLQSTKHVLYRAVAGIGKRCVDGTLQAVDMIGFFGRICTVFARGLVRPRILRISSIVRHMDETGIGAAPIVALLAFLISVVLSYQAATQLKPYGAEIFTIDLTAISILREMGVMLTAIIVAGRSGSAFAAEIGVMRLREETDALEILGLDPYETLVLPRVIALMITLPILTFLADIVGLAGGGLLSLTVLDISLTQYITRVSEAVTVTTFMIGIVKAPVFALLIAIVGTWQGMRTSGSAESVGRMTTTAVVRSIFLVLLADALFSILFSHLAM